MRLVSPNQLNDAAPVNITNTGVLTRLDLAGFSETVGATTITATTQGSAIISTGAAGILVLGADLALANNYVGGPRSVLISGTGTLSTATNDGTLDLGGALRTIAVTTTMTGANAANAHAVIETVVIHGGIRKTGAQTLFLTNPANTYGGGTRLEDGALNVGSDAALGALSGGVDILNGATLQAGGPVTSSRTFTLGAGGGKIDTNGSAVTFDGASTVAGTALTKTGSGVLTLAGAQSYATLNANGGVTNVDSALGTGTAVLNANATVNIHASQTLAALNIANGVEVTFGDGLPLAGGPDKSDAPVLVPEPGGVALLLAGALGVLGRRRR